MKVLARAANPPDHSPSHTQSHDLKIPHSVPSEQRSSGEVTNASSTEIGSLFSTLHLQGMDQSELDSNPSFPPTPVSIYMYLKYSD